MATSTIAPVGNVVRFGGHSRAAPLRHVLVRQPAAPGTGEEWRELGYPRSVDHDRAVAEHAAFRALLTDAGVTVTAAGPDAAGLLDAIFTDDIAITTDHGVIITRPGKLARQAEAAGAEASFAALDVPILARIAAPGTLEGGDTCWLDATTLAVGRSYRTNDEGIRQLTAIMAGIGVSVVPYQLSHYHGPDECLHLMSFISPIAAEAAVVYLPLMPVPMVEDLDARGWTLIAVPDAEFASMGCNVLALAPWTGVMVHGNPITHARLEAAGARVLTYTGDEISHNRAGGPTCLTRPIWRELA